MTDKEIDYQEIGFLDGECPENNIIYYLHKHAQLCPEKTALQWVTLQNIRAFNGTDALVHESIQYDEFVSKISHVGQGLKDLGIQKGDRVIIFVPMALELYVTMFAVQRIGASAVFLDSWARKDQLGMCANCVQPKAMISFEKAFDLCKSVKELDSIPIKVVIGGHAQSYTESLEDLYQTEQDSTIEPVTGQHTALITFTTGSSGVPKGANRTHRFLSAQHRALNKEIPYSEEDIDLPVFPVFSLNNIAARVCTVLPAINLAEPSEHDPAILVNQLFATQATGTTLSPSLFVKVAKFCADKAIKLEKIKRVVTGGAPISEDNVNAFKAIAPNTKIMILYGSTEVEPISHIEADEMIANSQKREGVNVGHMSEDLDFKVIKIIKKAIDITETSWADIEGSKGSVGELIVSGEHVCKGYYNNPQADKATKIKEPDGKIWHRTGDLVMLDENNQVWIVGRVHNVIVRKEQYLFPVQAEILLKQLEFVRQAAFLGVEDPELGEKAWAVVSLKKEAEASAQEAQCKEIQDYLSAHAIPVDAVKIVDNIPLDPRHHSKVEYAKLREQLKTE